MIQVSCPYEYSIEIIEDGVRRTPTATDSAVISFDVPTVPLSTLNIDTDDFSYDKRTLTILVSITSILSNSSK